MITAAFLVVAAMFAVAGTFISLEAKQRNQTQANRPTTPRKNLPQMVPKTSARHNNNQDTGARAA
jgi:hypothetical protein